MTAKEPFPDSPLVAQVALTWDGRILTDQPAISGLVSQRARERLLELRAAADSLKRLMPGGDPDLLRAKLAQGEVDEIHVVFSPRIAGGTQTPSLTGSPGEFLPATQVYQLAQMEVLGEDCLACYSICQKER